MPLSRFILATVLLAAQAPCAFAIQPVEDGLQPVVARLRTIDSELQVANSTLQQSSSLPRERFEAYQRFKVLSAKRTELVRDIERARARAKSPLIHFAVSPGAEQ